MKWYFDNYNIISQKQLDTLCDYSSEQIFDALSKITLLTNLYRFCGISIVPPFATNFRDALFHYKKLYESDTIEEAIAQSEAIDEHLSRAIKDSAIQLAQVLLSVTNKFYTNLDIDRDTKNQLQTIMHNLKQSLLKLRINSMDIVRISQNKYDVLEEISSCIQWYTCDKSRKQMLIDTCSKYVKKIDVYFSE